MSNNYSIILFDLDGTLTDSKIGITRCVQYALRAFDIDEPDPDKLCKFIGPPLKESFMEFYGFDQDQATQAVVKYRERFVEKGIFETELYPGIENVLQQLSTAGKRLGVATSKPAVFARQILELFQVAQYFEFVSGSELDNTRADKGAVIEYGLEHMGVNDTTAVIMIGDREHDIIGARKVGLASAGVLYGFGTCAELVNAGADYIIEDVKGITRLLL